MSQILTKISNNLSIVYVIAAYLFLALVLPYVAFNNNKIVTDNDSDYPINLTVTGKFSYPISVSLPKYHWIELDDGSRISVTLNDFNNKYDIGESYLFPVKIKNESTGVITSIDNIFLGNYYWYKIIEQ